MYIFESLTGASLIMKFLHTFCFYMGSFLYLGAGAQEPSPSFRNYNVEDGLHSPEIYQVKQESKGYIWFATNNRGSRFNGYEFENFSISDGIPDNTVFNVSEDSKVRMFLGLEHYGICEVNEPGHIRTYQGSRLKDKGMFLLLKFGVVSRYVIA